MSQIDRSGWVNKDCLTVFNVVNAVEEYPLFLKGCKNTKIIENSELEKTAQMTLGKGMLSYDLVTKNTLNPPHSMHMQLIKGPFEYLTGVWSFTSEKSGCRIAFKLKFQFKSRILAITGIPLMTEVADSMVRSFIQRAQKYEN